MTGGASGAVGSLLLLSLLPLFVGLPAALRPRFFAYMQRYGHYTHPVDVPDDRVAIHRAGGLAFVVLGAGIVSAAVIRWAGLARAPVFYGGGGLLVAGGLAAIRNSEERLAVRLVLLLGAAAVVGVILSLWWA